MKSRFPFIISALIITIALIIISSFLIHKSEAEIKKSKMHSHAKKVMIRANRVMSESIHALTRLAAYGEKKCTANHLNYQKEISFIYRYVKEAGFKFPDGRQCTSLMGLENNAILFTNPEWLLQGQIEVWLNLDNDLNIQQRSIVLGLNGHFIVVDPDHYIDIVSDTANKTLALLDNNSGQLITYRGEIGTKDLMTLMASPDKFDFNGWYYSIVHSEHYPMAIIIGEPPSTILAEWRSRAHVWLPVEIAAIGFFMFLFLKIYRRRISLKYCLRSAIRKKQFSVVYQPIIDLETRQCVGAEALIRWRQEDGTVVQPDLFIPIAERTDLIAPITDLVLHKIFDEMALFLKLNPGIYISVNLSAADIEHDRFLKILHKLSQNAGIQAEQICLEITETSLIDSNKASEIIHRFRNAGHRVYIDDFGIGYSSLSYLQDLQLDVLKIDKSFVDTINSKTAATGIISHIIEMAKSLNLKVVAEGVESEDQVAYLLERQVDYGQGWLFCKPLNAKAFIHYMQTGLV